MRLCEITDENKAWLGLHKQGILSIGQKYFGIINLYERTKKDKSLLTHWTAIVIDFNELVNEALDMLNTMPDQNDSFVINTTSTLQNYINDVNEMNSKLQLTHQPKQRNKLKPDV